MSYKLAYTLSGQLIELKSEVYAIFVTDFNAY